MNSFPLCQSNSNYIDQLLIDRPSFADKNFLLKFRVGMLLLPQKDIVDVFFRFIFDFFSRREELQSLPSTRENKKNFEDFLIKT